MSTWCAEATPGTSAVASLARERPSTAAVSPTRDRGEGDLKATVGSVTVKAGLSVSGRSGKRGKGGRSVPCERCQMETCGSLQLPCGRLVILCESCALEFYDVLIKKIAKFEATFEEFLLEQQEKQSAKAESPKDGAGRSLERSRDRDASQRPVTMHSPQRSPATRNEKFSSGAGESPARSAPSAARAGGGEEFIATRNDVKGGMGGLSGSRRRMERFAPMSGLSGQGKLESSIVPISQASNGRLMNDRNKLQRPATSATSGDVACSRDDRPAAAAAGRPRNNSFNPVPASIKSDVPVPSSIKSDVPVVQTAPGGGGLNSSVSAAHVNIHSQFAGNGEYGQSPVPGAGPKNASTTRSYNYARTSSGGAHSSGSVGGIDALSVPPDPLRHQRQRLHSDTGLLASAQNQAKSAQNLFAGATSIENGGHARGDNTRGDPPRVTKRLPSGSPLRRGSNSWDKTAAAWGPLGSGPNAAHFTRHTTSAHGQRGKWGMNVPGRESDRGDSGSPASPGLGLAEKSHLSRLQRDDSPGWGGAAGSFCRDWSSLQMRNVTKGGGGKGQGASPSAGFDHESLALTTVSVPGIDSSPRFSSQKQRPTTGAAPMPALGRFYSPGVQQRESGHGLRW